MKNQKQNLSITALEQTIRIVVQLLTAFLVARLVAPESFGWSAIALLITSAFTVLTQIGMEPYIISSNQIDAKSINKSWTLGIVVNFLGALLLVTLALFVFDALNQRIVLFGASLSILSWSAGAASRAILTKEYKFRELMLVGVVSSLSNLIVSVSIAEISRLGTLALISGQVLATFMSSVLSIRICEHKLKLVKPTNFEKAILVFYRNTSLSSLSNFAARNLDTLLVTASLGVLSLAFYDRAYTLIYNSQLALSQVFSRVFFAKYSQSKQSIIDHYFFDLKLYTSVSVFVCSPFLLFPEFVTRILYGETFNDTAVVLPYLAVAGVIQTFSSLSGIVFLAKQESGRHLRLNTMSFLAYSISFFFVFVFDPTIINFAKANIIAASFMFINVVFYLRSFDRQFGLALHFKVLFFPISALSFLTFLVFRS